MILYFDTETTGLHPGNICQLSYVMQTRENLTAKNFFFTVDYVEPSAQMVHGFSVEKLYNLSQGKKFLDNFEEINGDFGAADVVVAHNFSFDNMFMRTEYERIGKIFAPRNAFCTMKESTPLCMLRKSRGLGYKYPKLTELCEHFNVTEWDVMDAENQLFNSNSRFHDARFDTAAVYLAVNAGLYRVPEFERLEKFL